VVTRNQLQQVDEFRNQLLNRANDANKLELCAGKCNKLLHHNSELQILIAAYDDVISAACRGNESKKQEKPDENTTADWLSCGEGHLGRYDVCFLGSMPAELVNQISRYPDGAQCGTSTCEDRCGNMCLVPVPRLTIY